MSSTVPDMTRLGDYCPPAFWVDRCDLLFELGDEYVTVQSTMMLRRNPAAEGSPSLVLAGEGLSLVSVRCADRMLGEGDYDQQADRLVIPLAAPRDEPFELEIVNRIRPFENNSLEGLYAAEKGLFTQCEAEGFRRITYFPDRPDVMCRFRTTIRSSQSRYPVLLSNGNLVARRALENDMHEVIWDDPYPKPCYLFALVAADLACVEDQFETCSGRRVTLHFFAEHGEQDKCRYAIDSLKRAMRWDEDVYGLEYDLDLYMVVAVSAFNMGAMENKGLNIFNAQYVLARSDTATDRDFEHIESVVAHEYFHNWTGNRVTCRDWFQLSLKEGLTVFRDQSFSADMHSAGVQRIREVQHLRTSQFPEDSGPTAHPVRPAEYREINNLYTPTVYEKGAEVVRMLHTLLGASGFRRGMDLYFARHTGQAVTVEDFLAALADANGRDLAQFRRWYLQAGTPRISIRSTYDQASGRYRLEFQQQPSSTPGRVEAEPLHIPVRLALFAPDGRHVPLQRSGDEQAQGREMVLELRESIQTVEFLNVPHRPVASLFRGFSAPVRVATIPSREDRLFLLRHDDDPVNRWDAGQSLLTEWILGASVSQAVTALDEPLCEAIGQVLGDPSGDPAFVATLLELPDFDYLVALQPIVDPLALDAARQLLRRHIGDRLGDVLVRRYSDLASEDSTGTRALKNHCLYFLMGASDADAFRDSCVHQFNNARNMTDALAALTLLAEQGGDAADSALSRFYDRWRDEDLVVDKWLRVQAASRRTDCLERIGTLMAHPAFSLKLPNKVRALIGTFCRANPSRFHARDGRGYEFTADQVIALSGINPQVAARITTALVNWRGFAAPHNDGMREALLRIRSEAALPVDVADLVTRSLAD
ncbi:MAG: aminopeptidase N [Pseudomonadota bacterium]|nr:aminopeptidase N [Pseudomonadota bacterium]